MTTSVRASLLPLCVLSGHALFFLKAHLQGLLLSQGHS